PTSPSQKPACSFPAQASTSPLSTLLRLSSSPSEVAGLEFLSDLGCGLPRSPHNLPQLLQPLRRRDVVLHPPLRQVKQRHICRPVVAENLKGRAALGTGHVRTVGNPGALTITSPGLRIRSPTSRVPCATISKR